MSKVVAALATLLVAAHAVGAMRTITTTTMTVTDEQGRGMEGQCQQAVQHVDLRPCMEYLGHVVQEREGGPRFLRESQHHGGDSDQMLERCCDQLRPLERDQCVCEGLAAEMTQATATEPRFVSRLMSAARDLPGTCRVSPSTCHFPQMMI